MMPSIPTWPSAGKGSPPVPSAVQHRQGAPARARTLGRGPGRPETGPQVPRGQGRCHGQPRRAAGSPRGPAWPPLPRAHTLPAVRLRLKAEPQSSGQTRGSALRTRGRQWLPQDHPESTGHTGQRARRSTTAHFSASRDATGARRRPPAWKETCAERPQRSSCQSK